MAQHEVWYNSVGPFFYDDTDLYDTGDPHAAVYSDTGAINLPDAFFQDVDLGSGNITLSSSGSGILDIEPGAADTDLLLNFIGTTNSGELRWMEDRTFFHWV